jgi:N-acetyl-gamma-glutamyl-phosphate reductase
MAENIITIGIAGGTGYTAGELIRLLLRHPRAAIRFVHSASHAGASVCSVHTDLAGDTDMVFSDAIQDVDVLFLCLGHGISANFLTKFNISAATKIIDLGSDFRTQPIFGNRNFVYGLPELNKETIAHAYSVANPGCFATAIELALLPLAAHGMLHGGVHISAITGSSGAGRALSETTHFSWRADNVSVYKPFEHQHLAEIYQTLHACGHDADFELCFIPMRGNFVRGIFAAIYTDCMLSEDALTDLYSVS